jgi:hypothetical protein
MWIRHAIDVQVSRSFVAYIEVRKEKIPDGKTNHAVSLDRRLLQRMEPLGGIRPSSGSAATKEPGGSCMCDGKLPSLLKAG